MTNEDRSIRYVDSDDNLNTLWKKALLADIYKKALEKIANIHDIGRFPGSDQPFERISIETKIAREALKEDK